MTSTDSNEDWLRFCNINERRRAVRDFDGAPLDDADVRALLEAATLAPSSGNLQPYELHWVRSPELRRRVAEACESQRAALSASTLVVVAAGRRLAQQTLAQQRAYLEHTTALPDDTRAYYRRQLLEFGAFLRVASLAPWELVRWLLCLLNPVHSLLPLGPIGLGNWAARSSIYVAQTLMLAASARGIDSCPMEGFSARRVRRVLGLPRGHVIPIVIALGRRRPDARIEPRWRRALSEAVVEH